MRIIKLGMTSETAAIQCKNVKLLLANSSLAHDESSL